MNKKELTTQVAQHTGMTSIAASRVIDSVFETIKSHLLQGDSIVLQGFGSFSIKHCAARRGINPSTKVPMLIPARKMVKFSPSKTIVIE
ncbi:MAG: HU family DNA-binding protein [Mucinivorans sp.]